MDYEPGDNIDLKLSPNGLIIRHIYLGHCYSNTLPLNYKLLGLHWKDNICPDCGASDFNVFNFPGTTTGGCVCNICKIMWYAELGATCMECGRPIQPISSDVLQCEWCGQKWSLDVVEDSYTLGDHEEGIDWSISKGANR